MRHIAHWKAFELARAQAALSAAEVERLTRIHLPNQKQQFLAARWLLRLALAELWGAELDASWHFSATENEPVRVLQAPVDELTSLSISLSHSGSWIACAVAQEAIGVDIEDTCRRERKLDHLWERVCGSAVMPVNQAQRFEHFYRMWTLKEAWFKSQGRGIAIRELPHIAVHPASSEAANAVNWNGHQAVALSVVYSGATVPQLNTEGPSDWPVSYWRVGEKAND